MFRGVILVFSGVMLGFRRVIFGSEGLYRVQWGYVVSIQHVDLPPCRAGSAVKTTVFPEQPPPVKTVPPSRSTLPQTNEQANKQGT